MKNQYLKFWQEKGLKYITPKGLENAEGFDYGAIVRELTDDQTVLEVGCGTGRIAQHLDPAHYLGVDINGAALQILHERCPDHDFLQVTLDEDLPEADVVLLYTVCLHIPDDLLGEQISRFIRAAPKVIICEIMDPKYRQTGSGYKMSSQRSLERYVDIFEDKGWELTERECHPYEYYDGDLFGFCTFEKDEE